MGELEGEQIYVGVGSCSSGTEVCAEIGNGGGTYITIGANSCNGQEACPFLGYDATNITIGDESC